MGKRRLGDLAREVRLFAAPIPETRPKIVNRRVMNAHAAQRLQIESGDALDAQFREMARPEIEQFKREMIQREGVGANVESISDQELLREVMNTVGKAGRLGESIRCVVSVSMLTEGWDANTVTHILGIRAFGTQLLCEQVVSRALRRQSYEQNGEGLGEL
jgi:type III restriction enzyme